MNIVTTQEFSSITGGFVREMLLSYALNREGQRISQEAHEEANKDTTMEDGGEYDEHAPWQYHMDVGARMQEEGDKMTIDVGERARAAGVDTDALLGLVNQQMDKPRRP
jgi:hypothetical protein